MADPTPIRRDWQAVRDHSRTHAEFLYVYPVISRRSGGLSLGVNLNPDKRCNFDCVYCEVDRRTPARTTSLDLHRLREELRQLIHDARDGRLAQQPKFQGLPPRLTREIRDIAFSGDGEPTMIARFADSVRTVVDVRQTEGLTDTKLVLITDAAGLDKSDVREGLRLLDANLGEVWGKLDAGTEDYYRTINRSHVRFERILNNLTLTARERPIVIQTLLLRWQNQPMPADELEAYCDRLRDIVAAGGQLREVHAYTVARPTPEPQATRLTGEELEQHAAVIRDRTHLRVLTFA